MNTRTGLRNIFLSAVLTLSVYSGALASPLWIHDSSGRLATYDITTDTTTVIGNMGTVMTDIAFAPDGSLYGVSFSNLYSIDKTTASATYIGTPEISGLNALVFGMDGTLYGAGNTTTNLYSINTGTGAETLLGNMGYYSAGDLAFNKGNFYLAAATSGNDQLVAIQSDYSGVAIGSFGFDNVYGLATGENGVLYGLSGYDVFSVDTTTGAGTLVGNYYLPGLGVSYGSSFPSESAPVPEPSTFLMVGAALVGFAIHRRKGRKHV